jgi:hypothetical protein
MRAFYAFRGAPYRYGELEPLEVSQLETGRQLRFHHPQADVDRTSPNYAEMTRKGASTRSGLVWFVGGRNPFSTRVSASADADPQYAFLKPRHETGKRT